MTVIIRYGEIALKGGNRHLFEKRLANNIKYCLKINNIEYEKVQRHRGRILVHTEDECNCLKKIFGIVSFSPAQEVDLDIDQIKEKALELYTEGTFGIRTKRNTKTFMRSNEINKIVGAYVNEKTEAKVNLSNPDCLIEIEIYENCAYLFNKRIKGLGGLPVGTQARVALIVEDEKAIDAGLGVMKRGCSLVVVKKKDVDLSRLQEYVYGFELEIVDEVPENIEAIVVSDTLETMKEYDTDKLVLRPLI